MSAEFQRSRLAMQAPLTSHTGLDPRRRRWHPWRMLELMRTPHWVVTLDESLRLIRVTRSPVPFHTEAEMVASMKAFRDLRGGPARIARRLLLDVREGPLRNDDVFENTMGRLRLETFSGFAAVAILVKTAVGRLQMTRIQRDEGDERKTFFEEREALAYLTSVSVKDEEPKKRR